MDQVILLLLIAATLVVLALIVMRRLGAGKAAAAPRGPVAGKPQSPAGALNRQANWLEGTGGQVAGKAYHIGAREVTIGRKVGNYIQLLGEDVSRVHAKLQGTATGVKIIDQGGTGETWVNDRALEPRVPYTLREGDRLKIGQDTFLFREQGQFATNHGLTGRKVAGTVQSKVTAALTGVDWKLEVTRALAASGGDMDQAAAAMGVSREVFEKMVEQLKA